MVEAVNRAHIFKGPLALPVAPCASVCPQENFANLVFKISMLCIFTN